MPKSDHRIRVTKMLIRRAFTELLRTKPIQSISVKELCETAGINRGTFYAHYTDIYDLLKKMEEEMLVDFQQALRPLLEVHEGGITPAKITAGIFQCLKENADICTVTLGLLGIKNLQPGSSGLAGIIMWNPISAFLRGPRPGSWNTIMLLSARAVSGCWNAGWRKGCTPAPRNGGYGGKNYDVRYRLPPWRGSRGRGQSRLSSVRVSPSAICSSCAHTRSQLDSTKPFSPLRIRAGN